MRTNMLPTPTADPSAKDCTATRLKAITALIVVSFLGPTPAAWSLPINLFSSPEVPADYIGFDDSKLTSVDLSSVTTAKGEFATLVGSLDNPTPVTVRKEFTISVTTGWTKTWSDTVSASVNSSLEAKFKGIGGSLSSAVGTSITITEETSKSITTTDKTEYCATCEAFDVMARPLYTIYAGTYTWLFDDSEPLHFTELHGTWEVKVQTGTGTEIANYRKYPCPDVGAGSTVLLLSGCATLLGLRRYIDPLTNPRTCS